jgi:hypothetical protein
MNPSGPTTLPQLSGEGIYTVEISLPASVLNHAMNAKNLGAHSVANSVADTLWFTVVVDRKATAQIDPATPPGASERSSAENG